MAGNLNDHEVKIVDLKAIPDIYGDVLVDFNPDVVGITGVTCEANTMLKLASEAKKKTRATVVVGGIHVSGDPAFFNREEIDYIVMGLGKMSFRELISAMENGSPIDVIHGIAKTKPGSELAFTPRVYCRDDLVEDKAPRYDLVSEYRDHYMLQNFGFSLGLVSTAFGCPHRCSFCCIENATDGRYLTHDPETVIRDIELLGDISVIRLVDANTFGNVAQARTLCNKIQEKGIQKQFIADVRSDTVVRHPDLFREWRKAGLRSVIIGFEEIDDTKLIAINKANTTAVNTEAMEILHDMGITIVGDFIISPDYDEAGLPELTGLSGEIPRRSAHAFRPYTSSRDTALSVHEREDYHPRSGLLYPVQCCSPHRDGWKSILRKLRRPPEIRSFRSKNIMRCVL